MIYENTKEKQLIIELCDLALRTGGLQNKDKVDYILANMKSIEKNEGLEKDNKK